MCRTKRMDAAVWHLTVIFSCTPVLLLKMSLWFHKSNVHSLIRVTNEHAKHTYSEKQSCKQFLLTRMCFWGVGLLEEMWALIDRLIILVQCVCICVLHLWLAGMKRMGCVWVCVCKRERELTLTAPYQSNSDFGDSVIQSEIAGSSWLPDPQNLKLIQRLLHSYLHREHFSCREL